MKALLVPLPRKGGQSVPSLFPFSIRQWWHRMPSAAARLNKRPRGVAWERRSMVRDSVESLLGVDANARSQLPVVKPCQEIADRGSYTGYVSGVMAATGPAKAAVFEAST